MSEKRKKDVVVDTALSLFAAHGYHAVGVDRIKEDSGVAKMTLYKYFPSKEALIESVLLKRDDNFRRDLMNAVAQAGDGPLARLKAVFDWHAEWFSRPDFNGCMFIKAAEEFPDLDSKIRAVSRTHKAWVRELVEDMVRQAGAQAPQQLATHLSIVLDGLIVNANLFRDPAQVAHSWDYVERLLQWSTAAEGPAAAPASGGKPARK